MTLRVSWAVDSECDDPLAAMKEARELIVNQLNDIDDTWPAIFEVFDESGNLVASFEVRADGEPEKFG